MKQAASCSLLPCLSEEAECLLVLECSLILSTGKNLLD